MVLYTSKEILAKEDLYELQFSFSSCGTPFQYRMTKGELGWLTFVTNRYCIADWVYDNLDGDILTFNDPMELTEALVNDDSPYKAVCLSDDTALQKLFFWLSQGDED